MRFPLQFFLETVLSQTLMSTGKKKKHAKKDAASEDILDLAHASLKKFRKVTREIGKLSTGQKLVGGLALAAAGLTYLATRDTDDAPASSSETKAAADEADAPAAPKRHRKSPKHYSEE
jgi:hypothetical protein